MLRVTRPNPCVRPICGTFSTYEPRIGSLCCIDDGSGSHDHFVPDGGIEESLRADRSRYRIYLSVQHLAITAVQCVVEVLDEWPSIDSNAKILENLRRMDERCAEKVEFLQSQSSNDPEAAALLASLSTLKERNAHHVEALEGHSRRITEWSEAVKEWKLRFGRLTKLINDRLDLLSEHAAIIEESNELMLNTVPHLNGFKAWIQAFKNWKPKLKTE